MLWGAVIAQLLRPHILVPPSPIFQNIFFGPRPSLQKITNANTNTKIIFWRQTKTDKMTCIFFIGRWLQIWHLVDSLLTPCWHLVGHFFKCAIVQLWQLDIFFSMPFFHCQMFSCKVDNTFSPVAMTKYFPLTSLMFTAIVELSISTLICVKKVWELELNLTNHFHTSIWW